MRNTVQHSFMLYMKNSLFAVKQAWVRLKQYIVKRVVRGLHNYLYFHMEQEVSSRKATRNSKCFLEFSNII